MLKVTEIMVSCTSTETWRTTVVCQAINRIHVKDLQFYLNQLNVCKTSYQNRVLSVRG